MQKDHVKIIIMLVAARTNATEHYTDVLFVRIA